MQEKHQNTILNRRRGKNFLPLHYFGPFDLIVVNKWLILRWALVHGYAHVVLPGEGGRIRTNQKAQMIGWDLIVVKEKGTAHMRNAMGIFLSARTGSIAVGLPILLAFTLATGSSASAQVLEANKQEVKLAQAEGNQAQEQINTLDDDTSALESEYKAVLQQLDTLRQYNDQLRELIAAQKAEITVTQRDIDRVTTIDREVVPLMLRMVDGLGQFIELDVPFLIEERRNRINSLKSLMLRADASPAEKFRRVLEAYQIENEYGRTIEGYRGVVNTDDGRQITVDFLRVGRVALIYKTLDDKQIARWNKAGNQWQAIDLDFVLPVKKALSIAREQAAPDLLLLPIDAPEAAQ